MVNYYYYRISTKSETGKKLEELYKLGQISATAADELASKLHAVEFEMHPGFAMGGISALYFKRKPTVRRWEVKERKDGLYLCIPNPTTEAGRKVIKEITELPVVKMEQVAEAFGINIHKRHPDNHMLPMFFRVENEFDYVQCDSPLLCNDLEETTKDEFDKAFNYVNNAL